MNVRPATDSDSEDIETTARRSFRASYALSPQEITAIVDAEFVPEELTARIDGSDERLFVATDAGTARDDVDAAGVAELDADGTLRWLHVHPDARRQGVGTALVERVRDEQPTQSPRFTARVLESANEAEQFLDQFGLSRVESQTEELGGERFDVATFAPEGGTQDAAEPSVSVGDEVVVDGDPVPVRHEAERAGTQAPFYPLGGADETPVGFVCSQCGSTDVTGDGLDRLECDDCGNTHRPDDWDPAYL
ncbi:GNAT family N-acetyltransferase [Halomicroarcula sp. F13]|uniref:GNAT family N-acetyltransferase n=1 Tax=Haloarcula rubra TaxID=2487747 RepID=A0AAW4PNL6_9EURY|nr:GNAT family N-acetyltransferase [Halomicroarcula rubra]MBX0322033.1 GNAT family N-acetyltransferase [Halomicroarcula rubra]